MKIIKPITNTPSMIISSNATELYANWNSTTYYAVGAKVVYSNAVYQCTVASPALWDYTKTYAINEIVRYSDKIYKSLQAGNLNKPPDVQPTWWVLVSTLVDYNPVNYPLLWSKLSSSNKWAMFDGAVNSTTTRANSLSVTFKTGLIDSLAVLNMNVTSVTITVRDSLGGNIIYQKTVSTAQVIIDWYEYFFEDFTNLKNNIVFSDIPPYLDSHVTLDFEGSTALSVGEVVFGKVTKLGYTQEGLSAGIIDYSRKETDDFGNVSITKRAFSKKMQANVYIEQYNLNKVQRILYDVRSTPIVWIASDDSLLEEAVITYGFYRDFSTTIAYATMSMCSIEIEGLI